MSRLLAALWACMVSLVLLMACSGSEADSTFDAQAYVAAVSGLPFPCGSSVCSDVDDLGGSRCELAVSMRQAVNRYQNSSGMSVWMVENSSVPRPLGYGESGDVYGYTMFLKFAVASSDSRLARTGFGSSLVSGTDTSECVDEVGSHLNGGCRYWGDCLEGERTADDVCVAWQPSREKGELGHVLVVWFDDDSVGLAVETVAEPVAELSSAALLRWTTFGVVHPDEIATDAVSAISTQFDLSLTAQAEWIAGEFASCLIGRWPGPLTGDESA